MAVHDIHFFCSSLKRGGKKICWPVQRLRSDGYFEYVRGLGGRFKDKTFSIVSNELYAYVPDGYAMAPGTKTMHPQHDVDEWWAAERLTRRLRDLGYFEGRTHPKLTRAMGLRLLREVEKVGNSLRAKGSGTDLAWGYYDKDIVRARAFAEEGKTGSDYLPNALWSAVQMIRGAASRESRTASRDLARSGSRGGSHAAARDRGPRAKPTRLEEEWYRANRAWGWEADFAWRNAKKQAKTGKRPPLNLRQKAKRARKSPPLPLRDSQRARGVRGAR